MEGVGEYLCPQSILGPFGDEEFVWSKFKVYL